jgi:hypothetical protein
MDREHQRSVQYRRVSDHFNRKTGFGEGKPATAKFACLARMKYLITGECYVDMLRTAFSAAL